MITHRKPNVARGIPSTMSQSSDGDPKWNPDEQRILDEMAKRRGEEFIEEYDDLIVAQAKLIGEL